MSVARKTHIVSSSTKSFQDAFEEGLSRASETLRNITGSEILSQKAKVTNGKISEYRVESYVTFILEDER